MSLIAAEVAGNPSFDWDRIKSMLCGLISTLELLVGELPDGSIKSILNGFVALLKLICDKL